MLRRTLIVLSLAAAARPLFAQAATPLPYPQREEVRAFIDAVVVAHGFERSALERVLAEGRYSEAAERLTTPALAPPSSRNWLDYRTRNVDERRIRDGVEFWRANRTQLARAAARFGVPEENIVAIIGIETLYGRLTGTHRTLDVLLTLAFDYPRRASFYREELAQFLVLCREQRLDPLAQRGSFAGALGLPQFMPGSVRRHAIDFDGDGRVDLGRSVSDAIGSVASFLVAHGWLRDVPVQFAARTEPDVLDVVGRTNVAAYRWQDIAALGVTIDGELAGDTRVMLVELPFETAYGEAIDYRIGTVNFAALLHYNRSTFYATAVAELAAAIRARYVGTSPAAKGSAD